MTAPIRTSEPWERRATTWDCHHDPAAQVRAATEIVTPAAVTDIPRTCVSISGT
jgi:hypothetical protein